MSSPAVTSFHALRAPQHRLSAVQPAGRPMVPARLHRPMHPSVAAEATYKVTFKLPDGEEKVIDCPDDMYILDAAEDAGLDLPYACHGGTCSSCTCRVVEGTLDQSEQDHLDEGEMAAGFALICSAYPTSDLVLQTHQETALQDYDMAATKRHGAVAALQDYNVAEMQGGKA